MVTRDEMQARLRAIEAVTGAARVRRAPRVTEEEVNQRMLRTAEARLARVRAELEALQSRSEDGDVAT